MKTLTMTPTEPTSVAALPGAATAPAAAATGNASADPLAALLSFAEQMLANQQPVPAAPAEPQAPVAAEVDAAPETTDQPADLAGTLPQALAVALQMQPPAAVPHKAAADDEHEHEQAASPAVVLPAAAPIPVLVSVAAPAPVAQDLAPDVAARTASAPASTTAQVIEAKPFVPDAGVDAKPAAKDDDGAAAPALPVLAGNNATVSTDTKFSLPQAAPVLRLPHGDAQQWQSPLMQALGDRIQLQLATKSDTATIRLEPPQMGRVDIAIRQDATGSLQVNLSATHGEVVHQLQQISEGMRWNLAQQRQGGEVVVQVSASAPDTGAASTGRDGSAPRQPWQQRDEDSQRPGRALAASDESTSSFALS
ncbi:flagellar hook-length control protein FliK [Paucibacter sp. R3-3]|uniref:Flagellar hook-length control protein FliK n=1 Tax=Roseateles agri TaxID=3098619 RepID=A0ABU5DQV7_9BURK|nr:flagellar hook-length control protein FliK [Paucibacter sp. R3-3]MDY0747432.1 flagellar hook-length control protein FliK [Paucibacter sp. R3-3]